MRIDQYAFVPARGGVVAAGGELPHVADDWEVFALRDVVPGRPRYLRVAAHVALSPEHVVRLRVFEPVDEPGTAPERVRVPEALRPAFDRCLAELAGAPVPPRRSPWARRGWHEEVEAWAGMPLEQVRSWPLAATLRGGDVWLKATMLPLFRHEPAVTEALGVPRVLRADHERGWLLLEHVDGEPGADHHAALRAIAAVHRAWTERVDEALALGAWDRRAPSPLGPTLVHGDFHPWNVLDSTIIDWSDAAVASPLHDVNHYLLNVEDELRAPLIETYSHALGHDVRGAADAYEAEAYEYVAESYARITRALAEDDRWWFAGEESKWLSRAADVRAGRRPSRGS